MKNIVLGITGASGAPYARRLTQCLVEAGVHVHLVASALGRQVMFDELGIRKLSATTLIGREADNLTFYNHKDVGSRIASGSFQTEGMVVCPCSSNTLAALASGLADNAITRAATVTMKEGRRLIVVHREMPVGPIELENMLKLARLGVTICPASPGFYMLPQSIDDLLDFLVGRVMDLLKIPHTLNTRWEPATFTPPANVYDAAATEDGQP